ncbi:THUMP-like domain-containing protein [Flavobacterium sp. HJJ]|uniref:THUMP-like domain-containing protein n=1 Tax=Flavobacterium sp. HJJ TaxID=2783792 RepID=UPI00188B78F4|nr:class I SAM-dependent methyltransferase [Flavobacterium sp. HJJ]MBF4472315.1 class I SAM-dependent methyltransferase [Flavobacterium sp. HJJ]
MNLDILNPKIQEFINLNIGVSVSKLALQKNPFPTVEWILILNQIAAKSKAQDKLPTWFAATNIIYPSKISVEQTSSEITALHKASIVSGENLIDLTGGFGVDDYYFSKKIKNVTHCEINSELSKIVKHNFSHLNNKNITCCAGDSNEILSELKTKWDWIYIDPSRRNDTKGKVFMLKDCLPNVPENLDFYFEKTNYILIKTAPILDISAGINELNHITTIHIVAVDNEVKELLWELNKGYNGAITIKAINLAKEKTDTFEFILDQNQELPSFSLPKKYLYEPNSAIMKSGGFDQVGLFYKLDKLHKHSHLYTSDELIPFPGRIFQIEKCIPYNKSEMKIHLENQKANITTRNFTDTVENIRKKWKIKEGGNLYCFFTTDENNSKIVLICNKIK